MTDANATLAGLNAQISGMQAMLVRLAQEVADAEAQRDQNRSALLVDTNERLVLAALSSRAEATAAREALAQASHSALHDRLTGLANRAALVDRFEQAAAHARRHGNRVALLFLDLDGFKTINDTHGHPFGDELLRRIAGRLVEVVREVDSIGRYGGDEFLVLLPEVADASDARSVADKLAAAVAVPMEVAGRTVSLTASIGVAVFPDDGDRAENLLAKADAAMYAAKRQRHGPTGALGSRDTSAPDDTGAAVDAAQRMEALREANERLLLAALGAQQMHVAAEQARQRAVAFLNRVSAELQDPHAPIRVATAMLGQAIAGDWLLPRVQDLLTQQLSRISQLVDAVNLDCGGLLIDRRRVDLIRIVGAAVMAFQPVMTRRRLQFDLHHPPGALPVVGDASRLALAVDNLLDNACRYTREGGRVGLSVDCDNGVVTLSVSDDGIGIVPQLLPHIFEPFVQNPLALGFNGAGLGIGLAVTHAIVRAHDGQIVAHSAGANLGSRFAVTLPLADSAPAPDGLPTAGELR